MSNKIYFARRDIFHVVCCVDTSDWDDNLKKELDHSDSAHSLLHDLATESTYSDDSFIKVKRTELEHGSTIILLTKEEAEGLIDREEGVDKIGRIEAIYGKPFNEDEVI